MRLDTHDNDMNVYTHTVLFDEILFFFFFAQIHTYSLPAGSKGSDHSILSLTSAAPRSGCVGGDNTQLPALTVCMSLFLIKYTAFD